MSLVITSSVDTACPPVVFLMPHEFAFAHGELARLQRKYGPPWSPEAALIERARWYRAVYAAALTEAERQYAASDWQETELASTNLHI